MLKCAISSKKEENYLIQIKSSILLDIWHGITGFVSANCKNEKLNFCPAKTESPSDLVNI